MPMSLLRPYQNRGYFSVIIFYAIINLECICHNSDRDQLTSAPHPRCSVPPKVTQRKRQIGPQKRDCDGFRSRADGSGEAAPQIYQRNEICPRRR